MKLAWEINGIDEIEGIYEATAETPTMAKYLVAVKKVTEGYQAIYLSGANNYKWQVGDVKANLKYTATPSMFKTEWVMSNKFVNENAFTAFERGMFKVIWTDGRPENLYIKLYPTANTGSTASVGKVITSGTAFALSPEGFVVTNHHVVEGMSKIKLKGVNGEYERYYNAKVIVSDKNNDLAILKIEDPQFTSIKDIPYGFNFNYSDVGESVFVLGYPLRATMGDEIKLTNGIISSKTGFQGDITYYQISVPIQPGNSGGPLFNSKGNLIGVVTAKHIGAENASYAKKSTYLNGLFDMLPDKIALANSDRLSGLSLSEQVKLVKNYVYIIECE